MNDTVTRTSILNNAKNMVNGEREADYGTPENNFATIAALWGDYLHARNFGLDMIIDAKDVAALLVLLKVARIASGHAKNDNWVDIAGYAACGGEIEDMYDRITRADHIPDIEIDIPDLDADFIEVANA